MGAGRRQEPERPADGRAVQARKLGAPRKAARKGENASPETCATAWLGVLVAVTALSGSQALSQDAPGLYGVYGTPGLVDMPTARSAADAEVATTVSSSSPTTRTTFTFQVLPRVSGSFRYSVIEDYSGPGANLYDRSFDLRFTLAEERGPWPEIALGLQDVLGTGVFAGEYLVATRRVSPSVEVTGGLGWGRFASDGGFDNPLGVLSDRFSDRPPGTTGGGRFNADTWFRGDAALFGGISWQATERLTLKAEYSSDGYANETRRGLLDRESPVNVGLSYRVARGVDLSAFVLHGTEVGIGLTGVFNPKSPPLGATPDPVPPPIAPRRSAAELGWGNLETVAASAGAPVSAPLRRELSSEGLALETLRIDGTRATVRVGNLRYRSAAQALGRTARVLARRMPAEIETFVIVVAEFGMPITTVRLRRSDLEALEFAPDRAWQSFVRADISDALAGAAPPRPQVRPPLGWSLGPYLDTEVFDPDAPLRADVGLRAQARVALGGGTFLSGSVRKKAFGNLDTSTRPSDSVLPRVRSENAIYNREGDPALEYLVAETFFRPGDALYGRVTTGYLEKMFGGLSTELLWKPHDSRFGLGAEINYVRQRDFDQLFGFRDYDVVTGHVSGYYGLANGFHARLDAGRYLAGDWGSTLEITREFDNGFRIGAFATLTDVSFDDFGEGSFDKGIRVTIPLDWVTGRQTRQTFETTIRPVLRDGGARVSVPNRLYDIVRPLHDRTLQEEWPRFWR